MNKRRRQKVSNISVKTNFKISKKRTIYIVVFSFVFFLIIALLVRSVRQVFEGSRVVLADYNQSQNSHMIRIYDFARSERTDVILPSNMQVSAAHGRGNWRLSAIPEIIKSEGLEKQFYATTLMKSLDIPVDRWKFGLSSNLSVSERIKLFLLTANPLSRNINSVNLVETFYLSEQILPDGEVGFARATDLPTDLKSLFVDAYLGERGYRTEIVRRIDTNYDSTQDLVNILATLGLHVVNIKREESQEIDCKIYVKEEINADRLSDIFSCPVEYIHEGNLDIRIEIGNEFSKRF